MSEQRIASHPNEDAGNGNGSEAHDLGVEFYQNMDRIFFFFGDSNVRLEKDFKNILTCCLLIG